MGIHVSRDDKNVMFRNVWNMKSSMLEKVMVSILLLAFVSQLLFRVCH